MGANQTIDKAPTSLNKVRDDMSRLNGGKAGGVCSIKAKLLRVGGKAVTRRLHVVLTADGKFGTLPSECKRGQVVPSRKMKGDHQHCNTHEGITLLEFAR